MQKIAVIVALLGGTILLSPVNAYADICPSGQHLHRLSGQCVSDKPPPRSTGGCPSGHMTMGRCIQ